MSLTDIALAAGKALTSDIAKKAIVGGVGSALGYKLYETLSKKVSEETLGQAVKTAKAAMAASSGTDLISFSQSSRVEPILLMDQRAVYVPFIQDVVHTMNSLFTAYYLQSIAVDTTIAGVKVVKRLDKFNPDRSLQDATRAFFSGESIGLKFPGATLGLEAYGQASLEAKGNNTRRPLTQEEADAAILRAVQEIEIREFANDDTRETRREGMLAEARTRQELQDMLDTPARRLARAEADAEIRAKIDEKYGRDTYDRRLERAMQDAEIRKLVDEKYAKVEEASTSMSATKDMTKMVTDVTNLAVGKIIEVTITEGNQSARIPVSIRLRVTSMPADVMTETLAVGGVDVTAGSRWKAWRAGELRFWADLVLAQDRIDAHRNAIRKDQSGYYNAVASRATKNLGVELMGGGPSLGTASSIIVMTEQTKKELERKIGGRLSDYKTRQGIFINTYSMLMAVVDPDFETVTIYHRGIELPTELTAKYLQSASKGTGPDVAEILKAYQLGSAPHRL